jgi:hypothetical protein
MGWGGVGFVPDFDRSRRGNRHFTRELPIEVVRKAGRFDYSQLLLNVVVNMTTCVSTAANLPSYSICFRNVYCRFNTIWHPSITIQSSCRVAWSRFKNMVNASPTADSAVTNTTAAASGG